MNDPLGSYNEVKNSCTVGNRKNTASQSIPGTSSSQPHPRRRAVSPSTPADERGAEVPGVGGAAWLIGRPSFVVLRSGHAGVDVLRRVQDEGVLCGPDQVDLVPVAQRRA